MGYYHALEAAGARVIEFEEFGSYQGDWYALVEYNNEIGWINGSYGSCSGCDSFESEFGYGSEPTSVGVEMCDKKTYKWRKATQKDVDAYRERLVSFGKAYLDGLFTQEDAEANAVRFSDWDGEAAKILAFLKEHTIEKQIN